MEDQIEEIKSKIDVVEFISQYVEVKKAGRNFKALCPFHQEKSPSFVISPDRQIWHCFGTCGEGGNVIKFLMKIDNLTFIEALRELAQKTGVKLETMQSADQESIRKDTIYAMNNWAARFYAYLLKQPVGKKAYTYVVNRGINDKIMQTFELGYAPESWDSLVKYLKSKKYTGEQMLLAGLAVSSANGRVYDRFRNRLLFPIKDTKGNVIGFSGRLLDDTDKSAKYINTPETPVYHKRMSLYGIHLAQDAIRREENVYVVEGEFDMITPFQKGISNIVAIKGAALTKEQLTLLKRYTNKITLALDTDEAGIEAMKRGINEAQEFDFDIRVAKFSKGKDPDEAATTDFITFKKELEQAIPLYDYLFEIATKKYPEKTSYSKKQLGDELIPYLRHIQNIIIKSHYTKKLAELLEMKEEQVERLIYYAKRNTKIRVPVKTTEHKMPRDEMVQKYLLSILFQSDSPKKLAAQIFSVITKEDFSIPSYQKIITEYQQFLDKTGEHDAYTDFAHTIPSELKTVADEIYLYASGDNQFSKEKIWDIVFELLEHRYRMKYATSEDEEEIKLYKKKLDELDKKELEKLFKSV
ncbi:MAG TPA: DNA primase [Candidatus Woesebacteria bacterium]|nr:DNA primase [Candidatus Woesebacteria bacterium]